MSPASGAPASDAPASGAPATDAPTADVRGLVVFDLDGTLLRGMTACEVLAERLGRSERMRAIERSIASRLHQFQPAEAAERIAAARREMATWYGDPPAEELLDALDCAETARNAALGIEELHRHGFITSIATLTWSFAAERIARRIGIDRIAGAVLGPNGAVEHFWPEDKATWLRRWASELRLDPSRTVAVGDSPGDFSMLRAAGLPVYLGTTLPPDTLPHALHLPEADILDVARHIIAHVESIENAAAQRHA